MKRRKAVDSILGKICAITFNDHVNGAKELIECTVYGKVVDADKDSIVVVWWEVKSSDKEFKEINQEFVTIIKPAIKHIEIMQ